MQLMPRTLLILSWQVSNEFVPCPKIDRIPLKLAEESINAVDVHH